MAVTRRDDSSADLSRANGVTLFSWYAAARAHSDRSLSRTRENRAATYTPLTNSSVPLARLELIAALFSRCTESEMSHRTPAVLVIGLVFVLFGNRGAAEIRTADVNEFGSGGSVHEVKIAKLDRDFSKHEYLVAVTDSDRHLKLIGFEAGHNYIRRRADARTTGPAGQFDLDAMNGIVLTAFQDREDQLRVTTWDARDLLHRIRRLHDWEGGRVYRVSVAYLRQIDGFYRFVTAVSDSDRNLRVIVWDVEPPPSRFTLGGPNTGRIHRRGHAVGGKVGEVSVALLHDNVVNLNAPTLVATAVTDADNNLWTRVWKIDRAGNVSQGAGIGAGHAYKVGLSRVSSSLLLASVREGEGRLKMISYKVDPSGDSIQRMGDHLVPAPVGEIAACRTNSTGAFTAIENHSLALSIQKWSLFGEGRSVLLDDESKPRGTVDRVSCAGNSTLIVAAVRARQHAKHQLIVIPYVP